MVDPTVLKSVALCVWVRVPPGVQSADVAKLVDALDLGSSPLWGGGSIPPIRTKMDRFEKHYSYILWFDLFLGYVYSIFI